jgi:transposase
MSRGDMTDRDWQRLQPLLPPEKTGKRGGQWRNHRQVIDGIRWIGRTGAPWRDLPERYGPWQTCAERLYRWQQDGLWPHILQTLQSQEDATSNVEWEGVSVDSTTIKAHPHAAGARKPLPRASNATSEAEKRGLQASQQSQQSQQTSRQRRLYLCRRTRRNPVFAKCSDAAGAG